MKIATWMNLLPALVIALPLLGGALALPLRRLGERGRGRARFPAGRDRGEDGMGALRRVERINLSF